MTPELTYPLIAAAGIAVGAVSALWARHTYNSILNKYPLPPVLPPAKPLRGPDGKFIAGASKKDRMTAALRRDVEAAK